MSVWLNTVGQLSCGAAPFTILHLYIVLDKAKLWHNKINESLQVPKITPKTRTGETRGHATANSRRLRM